MPTSAPATLFYARTTEGALHRITHSHGAILGLLAQPDTQTEQPSDGDHALWWGEDWASPDVLLGMIFRTWWIGGAVVTGPKR